VFQNYALFPHLSVFENVAYGLQVRGLCGSDIAQQVADVLALVGLKGYEHQFSSQLSGGEQQRVALARAIVIRPRVLLFDEPLSNLDAKLRVQMRTEIRDLQRRLRITTVYVTHDQEEAMAVSDRIAVMNQGSVVQDGTAADLYHRPANEFVATFVGRVNLVPGTVLAVEGAAVVVAALGGTLRARIGATQPRAGATVKLVVRPEAIDLVAPSSAPLQATIVTRSFLGEKTEFALRCGAVPLQAVRYNASAADALAEGAVVGLQVDATAVTVLPGEPG
jgi:iron(III) transport system ATP-binding protein